MKHERTLLVHAKKGRIKCYSASEIRGRQIQLALDGWTHTATIDPAKWIEAMANGHRDPSDMLDELQFADSIINKGIKENG